MDTWMTEGDVLNCLCEDQSNIPQAIKCQDPEFKTVIWKVNIIKVLIMERTEKERKKEDCLMKVL